MCGPIAPSRAPRSNWRCAARACRSRWSKSPFTNADPKPAFPTSMSNIPEQLRYAASHEWISVQGDIGTVGITDHAQHELSDVVYVDLPKAGAQTAAATDQSILGNHAAQRLIVRFARDGGNMLTTEHQANTGESRGRPAQKRVVEAAATTEPETIVIKGESRNESAIEFRDGDAGTAQGVGLAHAARAGRHHLVPARDFVPVELGPGIVFDHERQDDALALRPGFLHERRDVGFRGQGGEERDAPAGDERGQVRRLLAHHERGLRAEVRAEPAQSAAHRTAQRFLRWKWIGRKITFHLRVLSYSARHPELVEGYGSIRD